MSKLVSPLNIKAWIEENRALLKPPVGNKCVWNDGEFIVMVVGGPNNRKDYHYNETPEFFYQLEGDIILKIIDNGVAKDVHIKEGDIYLLPAKIPHSPQRGANTGVKTGFKGRLTSIFLAIIKRFLTYMMWK